MGPAVALAACVGAFALWAIGAVYKRMRNVDALGFGDVKLFAGLSAAVGLSHIAWITLLAALAALMVEAVRHGGMTRLKAKTAVPFGCYLTVSGGLVWLIAT